MNSIEELANDLNFDELTMHAQTHAQTFYEKSVIKHSGILSLKKISNTSE